MKLAYDLIVLGAGSGGLEAAYEAVDTFKKRVAVVDTQRRHGPPNYAALGGTCVNVGCVPKKLMVIGSIYREGLRDCRGFGWNIAPDGARPDWQRLIEAKNKAVSGINESYEKMFRDVDGLDFFEGWGSFASSTVVEVRREPIAASAVTATLEAPNVIIATGSWPFNPDLPGVEHTISSNEAFYLPECPKRVLMVGGGFIAVEFAGIFNAYKPPDGKVTLAYRGDLFLRGFDTPIREELANQMRQSGIDVLFKENPAKVELLPGGVRRVTFDSGRVGEYDCVMYSTGRKPRTDKLNLDAAGVALKPRGGIAVDEYSRTNVKGIFAIGDVTARVMLTPVAIREADCAVQTMFGPCAVSPDHTNIPSAVFSIPPIGTVGMLEEDAAKKYDTVAVYQMTSLPLAHQLTGASYKKYMIRMIADHATGKVLGVHLLAMEGPEVIQVVGVAMKMGVKVSDFRNCIGVHPTFAEDLCSFRYPYYYYVKGVKKDKL